MFEAQHHAIGMYSAAEQLAISRQAAKSAEFQQAARERKQQRRAQRQQRRAARRGQEAYTTAV